MQCMHMLEPAVAVSVSVVGVEFVLKEAGTSQQARLASVFDATNRKYISSFATPHSRFSRKSTK